MIQAASLSLGRKQSHMSMPTTSSIVSHNGETGEVAAHMSWRRWAKLLFKGRPSIGFVLVLFSSSILVVVSVLAWSLTEKAATTSAINLATDMQDRILNLVTADVLYHVQTAERTTQSAKRQWARGAYSVSDRPAASRRLLDVLVPFQDVFVTQTFTLMPFGQLWGYYAWKDASGRRKYTQWTQVGMQYDAYDVDSNGTVIDHTDSSNSTDQSLGEWVTIVNPADPTSQAWTPSYIWEGVGWQTFSTGIYDSSNSYLGVASTDMTLGFLTTLLRSQTDALIYPSHLFAFEIGPNGEVCIGSSDRNLDTYIRNAAGDPLRAAVLSELAKSHALLGSFYTSAVLPNYGGSLAAYFADAAGKPYSASADRTKFNLRLSRIKHLNIDWIIVQFVSQDAILANLYKSNRTVLCAVISMICVGCALAVVFAYLLSRSMNRITADIVLLSQFKFQEVLGRDDEGRIRRPSLSRFAELYRVQRAFHTMVVTFAGAVSNNRKMLPVRSQVQNDPKFASMSIDTKASVPS
ncbi:hypothetical protein DFJ77DRAFT_341440 [Powellomyces hirtus]|nr:hypothetical protein DFJ77DRAFT_341440 [Powellomyces hirtus]